MRERRILSRLLAIAPLVASVAAADAASDDNPEVDCVNGVTQTELNICSYRAFERDDKALNDAYRAMTKKLTPDEKRYAVAAQTAWIRFRDAECLALSRGPREEGGTIWPLLNNSCMSRLTRLRTKDLLEQAQCPAGRLDCPADAR